MGLTTKKTSGSNENTFVELLHDHFLEQLNTAPTRCSNTHTIYCSKGEFRFGPIGAYVYLLAVSQSKCPDLLYFRLRYDFYTRIPLYK